MKQDPPPVPPQDGIVILPFGRYFAAQTDMLTKEGFKAVAPIDGVSPFSAVGDPDPAMQRFAQDDRTNDRVLTDVTKGLDRSLASAQADYLVIDNSTALLKHRKIDGRWYAVVPGEPTSFTDMLWNRQSTGTRSLATSLYRNGFTDDLRNTYDAFIAACLAQFHASRIILVRSHCARFWVDEDGAVRPTNVDRAGARFLDELDEYFAAKTGCRVALAALRHVPRSVQWQRPEGGFRRAIEEEIVSLCTQSSATSGAPAPRSVLASSRFSAADHIVRATRRGRQVNGARLQRYFATGPVTFDDLLSLAYLQQQPQNAATSTMVRRCLRVLVNREDNPYPLANTRERFDGSLQALRRWPWRSVPIGRGDPWRPQIAIQCGSVVLRFSDDGQIRRTILNRVEPSDATAIVEGRVALTPQNLMAAIASWPMYIERARHGIRDAPTAVVSSSAELIDSCYWLDWATVFKNENVRIARTNRHKSRTAPPLARTDLSFVFDPNTRIYTVAGGLMDQVTYIALFEELCRRHELQCYIDDLRYVWWQSHNGFEASRLAPHLENARITRLISPVLVESFREDVVRTRLPWVYSQSRTWFDFGLREAVVVTWDHVNSRRLVELNPPFAVHIYKERQELEGLIVSPPSTVSFFTTQQRVPIAPESADAIRRVFNYRHLRPTEMDSEVAQLTNALHSSPHVALHIRRGDYLNKHFDKSSWHAQQDHYIRAIEFLISSELGTSRFNLAVFSDDLRFVESHASDYGIDLVSGHIRFVRGNGHYKSIFDSYLMSLCPVIVGSVGSFAATTSLLADPPSIFIRARPGDVRVQWRR